MKKIELGQSVNTLANIGVIVGIIFLGIELRQNNEILAAESRATLLSMQTVTWSTVIEQSDIAPLMLKDRRGERLTDVEELRLNAVWTRALLQAEFSFHEAPEQMSQQVVVFQRAFEAYGSVGRTWSGSSTGSAIDGKAMFGPEFVEFMDANVFIP